MTVSSTTNRIAATGDGSTEVYPYTFQIEDDDDLVVTVRDTSDDEADDILLVKTTDYTVSGVDSPAGGNVTLVDASQDWLDAQGDLDTGWKIVIRHVKELKQLSSFRNQRTFFASDHEDVFDRLVRIMQQIDDMARRAIRTPETIISSDFNPVLPAGIAEADEKIPVTVSGGGSWADIGDWPSLGDLATASADAAAAAASASAAASSASSASSSASSATSSASAAAASAAAAAAAIVPQITGTRASPSSIVAGTGIAFTGSYYFNKWFIKGTSGVVVSANPRITAGTLVGQRLILQGTSDTDYVDFDTGNGIIVNDVFRAKASAMIEFEWDGTNWVQIGRSDL